MWKPYAGGAGIAPASISGGKVSGIVINDMDANACLSRDLSGQ